jgi:signal transduction histidine kinase
VLRLADTQRVTAAILKLALADIPLDELLMRTLDLVLSTEWLRIERKGAIFLAEAPSRVLTMRAQRGLSPTLRQTCARVAFGTCLCGQAAATGAPVYSSRIDEHHSTSYPDMPAHGHYCVPIGVEGSVLGVISTYLAPGHECSQLELEFLSAIADTLAGVLVRRQIEAERRALLGRLEEALQRERLGLLAASAAHDFGNLLNVFHTSAQVLLRRLPLQDPLRSVAEAVERAAQRGAALTTQLKAFGREEEPRPEPLSLGEALRALELPLQRFVGEKIVVRLAVDDPGQRVLLDSHLLERAVLNLAANARDAMPEGGTLSVRVTGGASADRVLLEISDSGQGMAPEAQARLFEPFFTTKARGEGAGLGLASVRRFVKQAGGEIRASSALGRGTTFSLEFPCSPRAAAPAPA